MAYEKGDLFWDEDLDERGGYEEVVGALLPHSCGSWFIGTDEEIKTLITDLQAILSTPFENRKLKFKEKF